MRDDEGRPFQNYFTYSNKKKRKKLTRNKKMTYYEKNIFERNELYV